MSMKRALSQRTFMVPSVATLFAVITQAVPEIKFDFKLIVLVVCASLAWSLIETIRDVARVFAEAKYGCGQYAPAHPRTPHQPPA